jgi:hypothetical protein
VQGTRRFARVSAAGNAIASRGVSSVARPSVGSYRVTFQSPVNGCALTASQSASGTDVGPIGTDLGGDNQTVTVTTLELLPAPGLADRAFDISATC